MKRNNHRHKIWKRYKEVKVPWNVYDDHRGNECRRVLELAKDFKGLDEPVQRREFPLSRLAVLLLFKVYFNISYRTIASVTGGLRIHNILGLKRPPSFKTIQRTMNHLNERTLAEINRLYVPSFTKLAGVDSSGLKTTRRGAWLIIRFKEELRKRDFRKMNIFVDIETKKIIACVLTKGTSSDHRQLKKLLKRCQWFRMEIVLADGGYDTRACFQEIANRGAIPGIKVRKNASRKAKGCPVRKKAVIAQKEHYDDWKTLVRYPMRCVVEAVFSGTKRRFGEILSSIIGKFRRNEAWLRVLLWNICIYPR
jgi:transposase